MVANIAVCRCSTILDYHIPVEQLVQERYFKICVDIGREIHCHGIVKHQQWFISMAHVTDKTGAPHLSS